MGTVGDGANCLARSSPGSGDYLPQAPVTLTHAGEQADFLRSHPERVMCCTRQPGTFGYVAENYDMIIVGSGAGGAALYRLRPEDFGEIKHAPFHAPVGILLNEGWQ